ncbi:unnamed protein product [Chironomus riparius]|uniref:Choline transporter-like protein n=1 Tax=Chironomus riparius TaxID=315576 RepID=A0A9N9S3I4_9DIPT|nr:unnamed protein product [Chironomus riparius]
MSIEVKPSSERRCTNIPALIFAIVFISFTVILVSYCGVVAYKSGRFGLIGFDDLQDSCGNICGQDNNNKDSRCGDSDKTKFPKLLIGSTNNLVVDDYDEGYQSLQKKMSSKLNECVKECPAGYLDIDNLCVKDGLTQLFATLKATWFYIVIISFIAFIFSYVFLILFRHAAIYVIWVINIAFVALLIGLTFICVIYEAIPAAITFWVLGAVMAIFFCCFHERIALVAKLFKEASKALIDIPAVMFEPILTFISLLISFLIFASFAQIISYAGDEEPLTAPAHICNLIFFIFIIQFIIGCQNFIIAGTIVRWYFTRDKTKLHKPIKKSFSHLFKFHLGSVCLGAILITIVKIIKAIILYLKNSARNSRNPILYLIASCCMCLFDMLEQFLSFLVRNAYVVIAKDGTEFCDSGKRAYKLIMENVTDVIALNHFGDLVLMICRFLVVLIAGLVGYTLLSSRYSETGYEDHIIVPMIVGCIFAFFIAHGFIMVFEMTIDTIFISFCIDLEENDGQTKPYYMSESLKNIITEMKEKSGGTLVLGPKGDPGFENRLYEANAVPMTSPPPYSQMNNSQPQYPHSQQPMMQPYVYPSAPYPV